MTVKNKCTAAAPAQAVDMGDAKPFTIGSRPLLIGKNAPPQPETAPHIIGPKSGKANKDGAIAAFAARVKVSTTFARTAS